MRIFGFDVFDDSSDKSCLLCGMKECSCAPAKHLEDAQCPVCGYYCLGNGGYGCINKPLLVGENDSSTD